MYLNSRKLLRLRDMRFISLHEAVKTTMKLSAASTIMELLVINMQG
jgi:hypothetical protein